LTIYEAVKCERDNDVNPAVFTIIQEQTKRREGMTYPTPTPSALSLQNLTAKSYISP